MSKAEKTKEYIIEKSAPVFNRKGYNGTSLSDIMEATGLTKGSIYGNFENKDTVAVEVYKYNVRTMQSRLAAAMGDKETATAKLKALTGYYRESWKKIFERGGCPLLNACTEADDNAEYLKKYVQQSIKGWSNGLAVIIAKGQKNGEFKKSIDPLEAAYAYITVLEGGMMLAKIMDNEQFLYAALDRMDDILKYELKK
jgi:AcrR family transcriptional regulator